MACSKINISEGWEESEKSKAEVMKVTDVHEKKLFCKCNNQFYQSAIESWHKMRPSNCLIMYQINMNIL